MNLQLEEKAIAVLQTNDEAALSYVQSLLTNPLQIQTSIKLMSQSKQWLFVTSNLLIKQLTQAHFLPRQPLDFRIFCCRLILVKCQQLLAKNKTQSTNHLTPTLIQLSVCALQTLLTISQSNHALIFEYIRLYLSSFIPHENVLDDTTYTQYLICPKQPFFPQQYILCTKVLTSLIDKVVLPSITDFNQHSKYLKWFTDNYLQHILSYQIKYSKILFNLWLTSELPLHPQILECISISLKLLDSLITFPFCTGYNERQYNINIDKIAPDPSVKFPFFYHQLIYDCEFTQTLLKYMLHLLNQTQIFESVQNDVISILRIFGRIFNAERRKILSNRQEQLFEQNNLQIIVSVCRNFKFYHEYYLCSLFDLFDKTVFYGICCCTRDKISDLNFALAQFVNKIISLGNALFTSDGAGSLPKRCFQLLQYCRRKFCGDQTQVLLKISYQNIFQAFIQSLAIQPSLHNAMNELYSLEEEQNCFEQLSNKIASFYFSFHEKNNGKILSMKLDHNCHPQIKSFWFYFVSCLFVKADRGQCQHQISIILRFVDFSKKQNIPACILFMRKLAIECMAQGVDNGQKYRNTTPLWLGIQKATNEDFNNFLQCIIEKFLCSLVFRNEKTLKASLESLDRLKVYLFKGLNFFPLKTMGMISNFGANIHETPLQDLRLNSLRRDFFSLVSEIWLNSLSNHQYIYDMYEAIKRQLKNQFHLNLNVLSNFLIDLAGLLNGLHKSESKILLELCLPDLKTIFLKSRNQLQLYFSDIRFTQIFYEVAHVITKKLASFHEYPHSQLNLEFHHLLYGYLKNLAELSPSPRLCIIWSRMAEMNPLETLLPLHPSMKPASSQVVENDSLFLFDFNVMLKVYFENLHRVSDLSAMFEYTTLSINYTKSWWEEVMISEQKLSIVISLPQYASELIKGLKSKVPKNLKMKIQKLAQLFYEIQLNYPQLGSLNLNKTEKAKYYEQFTKVAWDSKIQ